MLLLVTQAISIHILKKAEKITRGEMHMKSTWKKAAIIAAILIPAFSFGITANALSFAGTQHSVVFEVSAETLVYGDFEYTLVGDDVTLTKFIGENDTYSIPAEIDGHTVTTIGEDCFKNSGVITATIPDSVTKIEKQAFYNCTYERIRCIALAQLGCP